MASFNWPGAAGTGDVNGPASSTDNAIARFNGTSGKTLQNSNTLVDDSGNITFTSGTGIEATSAGSTINIGTGTNTDTVNIGTGTNTQTIGIGTGVGATTINIGAAGDTVNISGDVFSVTTTNLNVTDKTILLNDGAVGSGTARGAGINIRDNDSDTQSYIRIDGSTGTTFEMKAPEASGVFTINPGSSNISINQSVATTDSPTFVSATLSGLTASRPLKIDGSKLITSGTIDLASANDVSGILAIANGGTGSSTKNFVDLSTTQTVGGAKTFSGGITFSSNVTLTPSTNAVATGSNADIATHSTSIVALTNVSLTSVASVNTTGVTSGHILYLVNLTGSSITIINNYGSPPVGSSPIINPYAQNVTIANSGAVFIVYDSGTAVWRITGGTFQDTIGTFDSQTPSADGLVNTGRILYAQSASASNPGMINTTTQTLAGVKTFSSAPNLSSLTASTVLTLDGSKNIASSSVSTTTLGYLDATSSIQTQLNGKEKVWAVSSINSDITLADHTIYLVDTSVARSLTLPTPAAGVRIKIKDATGNMNTNNITLVRAGSEEIDTVAASYVLDSNLQAIEIVSDGTDWFII